MIKLGNATAAVSFVSLITLVLCLASANGIYAYLYSDSPTKSEGLIVAGISALISIAPCLLYIWLMRSHRKELSSTSITITAIPCLIMIMLTLFAHILGIPW